MRTLNRQRANLVFSTLIHSGRILSPREVGAQERIFERDGVLRWNNSILGHCQIGVSLADLLQRTRARQSPTTKSFHHARVDLAYLFRVFSEEKYVLFFDTRARIATVVLKQGATPTDQLKAWMHALLVARTMQQGPEEGQDGEEITTVISSCLARISTIFQEHGEALAQAGWDFESGALETKPGKRIICNT